MSTAKIMWPSAGFEELGSLEARLRNETGLEDCLKQKLMSAGRKSFTSFINTNLKGLFYNAGRFTWTGETPHYAKHGSKTFKAQGLRCVEFLIGKFYIIVLLSVDCIILLVCSVCLS